MKRSMTCPKCQNRKLWVVPLVELARHQEVEIEDPMAEMARFGEDDESASGDPKTVMATQEVNVPGLEAYVCAQCGYAETYAISLEHIAQAGTLVDGAAAGPFR